MSHRPERKENDCLNCGAVVYGKFCHICGQENAEPKETFWGLLTHFVYDVTHFDGKFFSTVKSLLLRPGFLSAEYVKGKRNTYLNPIRMYVFTSAIFFLIFFSVFQSDKLGDKIKVDATTATDLRQDILNAKKEAEAALNNSVLVIDPTELKEEIALLDKDLEVLKADTTHLDSLNYFKIKRKENIKEEYKDVVEYRAKQASLPKNKRDGWAQRTYRIRKFELEEKYGKDTKIIQQKAVEKFLHSFPQLFFVSLPLFAFLLKLMYIRRKNFYYGDHAIYAIHLYCACFIFIFLTMVFNRLQDFNYLQWTRYLSTFISVYLIYYLYKSLRNFYRQSRKKTFLKLVLLSFFASVLLVFLFVVFFLLSAFTL